MNKSDALARREAERDAALALLTDLLAHAALTVLLAILASCLQVIHHVLQLRQQFLGLVAGA